MKITPPTNYSPITKPVCFVVESDEPMAFEVDIIDDATDSVIGRKAFDATQYATIDIVPYIYRDFAVEPILSHKSLIQNGLQRSYHIEIGDVASASVLIATNRQPITLPTLLTHLPSHRSLSAAECDQLLLFADAAAPITVECVASTGESLLLEMPSSQGVVDIVIAADDFVEDADYIEVFITVGSHTFDTIKYSLRRYYSDVRRIAWQSSLGSIERYTFPLVGSSYRTAERCNYRSAEGRTRTASLSWQSVERIVSDYESRATLCAIADIVSGSDAWIVTDTEHRPTQVEDRTLEAHQMGEIGYLQVEIVTAEEEVALC